MTPYISWQRKLKLTRYPRGRWGGPVLDERLSASRTRGSGIPRSHGISRVAFAAFLRRHAETSEPISCPPLRAKRSNPGAAIRPSGLLAPRMLWPLDCFVARAPRNDGWVAADPINSVVIGRRLSCAASSGPETGYPLSRTAFASMTRVGVAVHVRLHERRSFVTTVSRTDQGRPRGGENRAMTARISISTKQNTC